MRDAELTAPDIAAATLERPELTQVVPDVPATLAAQGPLAALDLAEARLLTADTLAAVVMPVAGLAAVDTQVVAAAMAAADTGKICGT
jgi:hypothetical protein